MAVVTLEAALGALDHLERGTISNAERAEAIKALRIFLRQIRQATRYEANLEMLARPSDFERIDVTIPVRETRLNG